MPVLRERGWPGAPRERAAFEDVAARRSLGVFFQLANVRGAVASLGLMALFTLILVVLNIERNTRQWMAPGGGASGPGAVGMPVAAAQVSSPEPHEGAWGAGPR